MSPTYAEESAHLARRAEVIAAVHAAEATDPNIGRQWNSRYGRQRIRNRLATGGTLNVTNPTYEVETLENGEIRRYSAAHIEAIIRRNERELTPEYAREEADRVELGRIIQAAREIREAAEAAELAEIAKFTCTMKPMAAGKARNALLKLHIFSGVTLTLREAIVQLIDSGKTISIREEWAIQEMTRTQFNRADNAQQAAHEKRRNAKGKIPFYYVGNYRLGKTAYNYAAFLIQSAPSNILPFTTTRPALTPQRIQQLASSFA